VAEKLIAQHALFGHQRALFQMGLGTLPHAQVLRAIELLGTEVAPLVRREVAAPGLRPPDARSEPVARPSRHQQRAHAPRIRIASGGGRHRRGPDVAELLRHCPAPWHDAQWRANASLPTSACSSS
jgi:hypothetical protein